MKCKITKALSRLWKMELTLAFRWNCKWHKAVTAESMQLINIHQAQSHSLKKLKKLKKALKGVFYEVNCT